SSTVLTPAAVPVAGAVAVAARVGWVTDEGRASLLLQGRAGTATRAVTLEGRDARAARGAATGRGTPRVRARRRGHAVARASAGRSVRCAGRSSSSGRASHCTAHAFVAGDVASLALAIAGAVAAVTVHTATAD